MSDPKRQHWVPTLYLREFATPETDGEDDPDVWGSERQSKDELLKLAYSLKQAGYQSVADCHSTHIYE